jgi:hypothetical protein
LLAPQLCSPSAPLALGIATDLSDFRRVASENSHPPAVNADGVAVNNVQGRYEEDPSNPQANRYVGSAL